MYIKQALIKYDDKKSCMNVLLMYCMLNSIYIQFI